MKVLLINPPAVDNVRIVREGRCMQRQEAWGTSWAPLSLATIAALLRDKGFTVDLRDCSNDGISFEDLRKIIRDYKPSLVIVNTATPSIDGDLKVALLTKEIDKSIKTVFFGIHVTALAESVFKENRDVEFIVDGEPEYTLLDFTIALKENKPFSEVKGLIYKDNGRIVRNKRRPFIDNLDELPYPAWDLINIKGYKLPITNRPFLLVLTGRGCPYSCTFCAAGVFYGKKPRFRSPQKIAAEIKFVKEKYRINDFLFWSENSIADRQHIYDISSEILNHVPGIRWVCNGRVDMVDEELLRRMKKAGCWMIGYGIESGTQRVLDIMKKNITLSNIEKAVQMTKDAGIEVTGHVIVGYPGETKDEMRQTEGFLKKLDLDYMQVYCSVPFPGSRVYDEAKEREWISTEDWSMFEQNFSVIDTPELSHEEVMDYRNRMIRSFYLDPRKIIKTLLKVKHPREVLFFLSFAKNYFTSWVRTK